MLGETRVRPEPIDVGRTIMDVGATNFELRGNPNQFDVWARLVEHAIEDLGTDEYETLAGVSATDALLFAQRLRHEHVPQSADATWHVLRADGQEMRSVNGALLNMAYGPAMTMPAGMTKLQITDLYEELSRRYR